MPIVSTVIAMLTVRLMFFIIVLIHANTSEIRPKTRLIVTINNSDIVADVAPDLYYTLLRVNTSQIIPLFFRRQREREAEKKYPRETAINPDGFVCVKVLPSNFPVLRPIKLFPRRILERKLYTRFIRRITGTYRFYLNPFSIYCEMSNRMR